MLRLLFIAALSFATLVSCTQGSETLDDERDKIFELFGGSYAGQIPDPKPSSENMLDITHKIEPVDAPQFGQSVLYYQLILGDPDSAPMQMKIFVLDENPNRELNRMRAYILNADQIPDISNGEDWSSLDPSDLSSFPDECAFKWSSMDDGFTGSVKPDACAFEGQVFNGTIRPDMTYKINEAGLGWEETLYKDNLDILVSTNGSHFASRQ